jgi:hypothetical protein
MARVCSADVVQTKQIVDEVLRSDNVDEYSHPMEGMIEGENDPLSLLSGWRHQLFAYIGRDFSAEDGARSSTRHSRTDSLQYSGVDSVVKKATGAKTEEI